MLKDEKIVGAIVIYRQQVRPFADKQIELVKNFAAQAVIAIENTRLLNELKQSLEQQTATADVLRVISSSPGELEPVFNTMLANATRLCDATFGILYLSEGDGYRAVAMHNVPLALVEARQNKLLQFAADASVTRAAKTKQPCHHVDARAEQSYIEGDPHFVAAVNLGGMRTVVSVPILKDDQLTGVISIYRQEVRPFTDKQIAVVENFAAQAVIAIENARLLSELREALENQTTSADILRTIASSPASAERALDVIAETTARRFGASNVNIRVLDGNVLRYVGSTGPMAAHMQALFPEGPIDVNASSGKAILERRQVYFRADSEKPGLPMPSRTAGITSSVVATPLMREGQAIGVLIVNRMRSDPRPFTESDLSQLSNFAAQAVIAIENARLLNELRDRTAESEARSQEIATLNQQLERRVADQVGEIERMGRLRRFLPPQVADLIVASGTEKQLESHRREITALFCDLRGFTGFSESADPEDVMTLLRDYHAAIGEIVIKYGGTLERFAGDGVMVIFNDPVPVENPALQAVLMALDMRTAIGRMIETWRDLGHDLGFGIGIAHGFATLGTIGFEGRFDYAAIGTVSNVASRLCDEAKPGQILISPRVRQAVEKAVTVEPIGEFALKGIRRPIMTYNVLEPLPAKPD
jgi:class 3 adenylate cyclase/putative methionine-R-sulfoxide reductase with GAF domain